MFQSGTQFQPPPTQYRTSAQSYGAYATDPVVASFHNPSVNGPPSAVYLPRGVAKTRGMNGRTLPPDGIPSLGQVRHHDQTLRWTPARPVLDFTTSQQDKMLQGASTLHHTNWNLSELFKQVRDPMRTASPSSRSLYRDC